MNHFFFFFNLKFPDYTLNFGSRYERSLVFFVSHSNKQLLPQSSLGFGATRGHFLDQTTEITISRCMDDKNNAWLQRKVLDPSVHVLKADL